MSSTSKEATWAKRALTIVAWSAIFAFLVGVSGLVFQTGEAEDINGIEQDYERGLESWCGGLAVLVEPVSNRPPTNQEPTQKACACNP